MECKALHVLVFASLSVLTKSLVRLTSCPVLQSEHSNYSFGTTKLLFLMLFPITTSLLTTQAVNIVLTLLTMTTTLLNKQTHQLANSSSSITSCLDLFLPLATSQPREVCSLFFVYPLYSILLEYYPVVFTNAPS